MKILYTKKFKEKLGQPWSNVSLGKVKLREGTGTGLTRQDISKTMEFPDSFFRDKITNKTYNSEMIQLPEGGIQIYLEIPEEDQSLYGENFPYQVIMFYYTDLLTDTESLAFVCYENIKYLTSEDQEISPTDVVVFDSLEFTSRRNIITLPNLSWAGNIKFSQSEVTEFLESKEGNLDVKPYLSEDGYVSKESWKSWIVDFVSDKITTPWIETTYINKYGIKIY